MKFKGQSAVVVGGSRGFGRSVVERLIARGMTVSPQYIPASDNIYYVAAAARFSQELRPFSGLLAACLLDTP